jgi:hypothetical protein
MTANHQFEHSSFRDRNGRIFYIEGSILRALSERALKDWEALSSTEFFLRLTAEGKIVQTERVEAPADLEPRLKGNWAAFLKHQTIPFISYPYEWSFGMLKDAALLQIELLLKALDEEMILKDSSAYNFQWNGTSPVFIDIPSFEKLKPGEPWVGYRQFCQMFLYPLFLRAYKDIPFQPWLRGSIDGIEPEHMNRVMNLRDLLRPGVFVHTYLQAKLQALYGATRQDIKEGLRSAGFSKELIRKNVKRLEKVVCGLNWMPGRSQWSEYASDNTYSKEDHDIKAVFVRDVVTERPWNIVWDLGCNTGVFSRIAAENSRYVVAMDSDHLAIERLYQSLKGEGNGSILPLNVNIADPSPNLGWRGLERKSLSERGRPDLTICLALIQHMAISSNIPVKEFIDWLKSLGTSLVIEFVTKEDPMVKTLLRNKEDFYFDYEIDYFERCLSGAFDIKRREGLTSGTRFLYFAQNRT